MSECPDCGVEEGEHHHEWCVARKKQIVGSFEDRIAALRAAPTEKYARVVKTNAEGWPDPNGGFRWAEDVEIISTVVPTKLLEALDTLVRAHLIITTDRDGIPFHVVQTRNFAISKVKEEELTAAWDIVFNIMRPREPTNAG